MLETLPDEKLPRFGPGRAPDGNFVLSEIELKWGAGTNAPDMPAKFADARADFSQTDYSVKQAIDGKVEAGVNGWAVAGAPGVQRHTAMFKLEQPIASTNGAKVQIVLKQQFGIGQGRQRQLGTARQALPDLEPGRAGGAVDEDFCQTGHSVPGKH